MLSSEDSDKVPLLEGEDGQTKKKSTLLTVAPYILITEFCERLAYYGFSGSLVLFFQNSLNYSNADAGFVCIVVLFFCIC